MSTPEALVQAQLDAYNAQDIEAFLACWHPDCEFVRWGGEVDLRGAARRGCRRASSTVSSWGGM
jgi:hypothetical protein